MSLRNRRKDFSQKPPKTPIIPGVLSVIDTPSINLTFNNSTQELQADLQSIISPGTYGSTTMIPVFTINSFGQIISITEVPASGGGGGVASVNAGINISITGTPTNPIINSLSDRYKTTSTTSNSVSNGIKTFTVDANLSYIPLQEVLVVHNPVNHMHGEVVSYSGTTLVVDIKHHTGSGTYTSWLINLDGTPVDAITGSGTINELAYFTGGQSISSLPVATYPNLTEVSYLKGVTSSVQNQLNSKVPNTRQVATTGSLTGGGDLSANRTLSLVNDSNSPGANKVYGTDALGAKGWKNDPSGGGLTSVGLILNPAPSSPAIQINNTPLTSNGNLEIQFLGGVADYVRGNGSLGVFPDIPSPTSVYPYTRRQYSRAGDHRALGYYQNKLFVVNNTANQVVVVDSQTNLVLLTTTINLANTSQIIDDIAVAEHWCTSTGGSASIARHNAVTGAFIASTTPTGVVTNAQQSRFASFSSTKSIGTNLTNVYTINPATFVTANLSAHGLGALMTYIAINKNPSSLQNGLAMVGGQNGIILFNCTTNAIVLAATTLSGVLGNVLDVAYDSTNDQWILATIVAGVLRVISLQPTGTTTFSVNYNITDVSSNDFALTGGNAKQISVVPIGSMSYLYVCVNQMVFIYNLLTGAVLKSQYIYSFPGTVRPTYGILDEPNKRVFFYTGGGSNGLVYELIYDE